MYKLIYFISTTWYCVSLSVYLNIYSTYQVIQMKYHFNTQTILQNPTEKEATLIGWIQEIHQGGRWGRTELLIFSCYKKARLQKKSSWETQPICYKESNRQHESSASPLEYSREAERIWDCKEVRVKAANEQWGPELHHRLTSQPSTLMKVSALHWKEQKALFRPSWFKGFSWMKRGRNY